MTGSVRSSGQNIMDFSQSTSNGGSKGSKPSASLRPNVNLNPSFNLSCSLSPNLKLNNKLKSDGCLLLLVVFGPSEPFSRPFLCAPEVLIGPPPIRRVKINILYELTL